MNVSVCSLRYVGPDQPLLRQWAEKIVSSGLIQRGRSDERWNAHLAGRAALAWLFARANFNYTVRPEFEFGFLRPYDKNNQVIPNLFVNISHTADRAVAVMAQRSIGVDTEAESRDGSKVYQRVATADEMARQPGALALGLPGIALWSAKEAFSKAVGLGLSFGLQDFQIFLKGSEPYRGHTPLRGPLSLQDPALVFRVQEGYLISVCGERSELEQGVIFTYLQAADLRIP